jgi:hypothetical protein
VGIIDHELARSSWFMKHVNGEPFYVIMCLAPVCLAEVCSFLSGIIGFFQIAFSKSQLKGYIFALTGILIQILIIFAILLNLG